MATNDNTDQTLCCSFCGKTAHEVRKLVAGPGVNICDGCIGVCVDITRGEAVSGADEGEERARVHWGVGSGSARCALCGMPGPRAELVLIEGKGVLCRRCVADVEALAVDEKWAGFPGEGRGCPTNSGPSTAAAE